MFKGVVVAFYFVLGCDDFECVIGFCIVLKLVEVGCEACAVEGGDEFLLSFKAEVDGVRSVVGFDRALKCFESGCLDGDCVAACGVEVCLEFAGEVCCELCDRDLSAVNFGFELCCCVFDWVAESVLYLEENDLAVFFEEVCLFDEAIV